MIAAIGLHGELGFEGSLIWRIPEDLKHFKHITMGHHLLLGRKTFESIGRPLPGRTSIVLTRNTNFYATGCDRVSSIEEALELARRAHESELMVCGGAEIYQALFPWAQHLYLTKIQAHAKADVFFPEFDHNQWEIKQQVTYPAQGVMPAWSFQNLKRKD